MPDVQPVSYAPNSLWRPGSRAFFKDQRAAKLGDILTVKVKVTDQANISNETKRSRANTESFGLPNALGLENNTVGKSFGVGSTLIAQVLHAASGAPTMGGSYATAALNIGAAAGPVLGAFGLTTRAGLLAPFWVAAVLTGIALVFLLVAARTRKDETAAAR